jgi:hypothetical protein
MIIIGMIIFERRFVRHTPAPFPIHHKKSVPEPT